MGADRLCKTFGPRELFGSKRFALHFVRKMQNVWTKRFARKTFGEKSNVNRPFFDTKPNKMHEAFCLCARFECKVWPPHRLQLPLVVVVAATPNYLSKQAGFP